MNYGNGLTRQLTEGNTPNDWSIGTRTEKVFITTGFLASKVFSYQSVKVLDSLHRFSESTFACSCPVDETSSAPVISFNFCLCMKSLDLSSGLLAG